VNAKPTKEDDIVIIGCGGIGGVLGATLHRAGVPICIVTPNEAVRDVWTLTGPILAGRAVGGPLPPDRVKNCVRDFPQQFRFAFVAVQPDQIESVTKDLLASLQNEGRVIVLSNGMCEELMAPSLGEERVVGAVVGWGARMKAPGRYTRTSTGGFKLGKLSGSPDQNLGDIAELLAHVGPVEMTENLRGARFSKLTINCAVTALGTVGGATLGHLLVRARPRQLALNLMREATEVAAAEGVALEPVTKIDLAQLAGRKHSGWGLHLVKKHAFLLAVGARYRKLRSSMLAAIERGREPAIDYINGEIVARGKRCGIHTPYNAAATQVIWEIYRGTLAPGSRALRRVNELAQNSPLSHETI
jgi:2-dehydropantoate 2-reductase